MKNLIIAATLLITGSGAFAGTTDIGSVTLGPDMAIEGDNGCRGSGLLQGEQITLFMGKSGGGDVALTISSDHKSGVIRHYCNGDTESILDGDTLELSCKADVREDLMRRALVKITFKGNEIVGVKAHAQWILQDNKWKNNALFDCKDLKTTYWNSY